MELMWEPEHLIVLQGPKREVTWGHWTMGAISVPQTSVMSRATLSSARDRCVSVAT